MAFLDTFRLRGEGLRWWEYLTRGQRIAEGVHSNLIEVPASGGMQGQPAVQEGLTPVLPVTSLLNDPLELPQLNQDTINIQHTPNNDAGVVLQGSTIMVDGFGSSVTSDITHVRVLQAGLVRIVTGGVSVLNGLPMVHPLSVGVRYLDEDDGEGIRIAFVGQGPNSTTDGPIGGDGTAAAWGYQTISALPMDLPAGYIPHNNINKPKREMHFVVETQCNGTLTTGQTIDVSYRITWLGYRRRTDFWPVGKES